MERIDCQLQKIGSSMKQTYKTYKDLPFSLHSYIQSGAFSNVYGGIKSKLSKITNLNYIPNANMSRKYDYAVKVMHRSKVNLNETKLLAKLQPLITGGVTPSLMIMYGYSFIDSIKFYGKEGEGLTKEHNITNLVKRGKGIAIMVEYLSNYTFADYLASNRATYHNVKSILFESFVALYTINHYLKVSHGDFHPWNIILIYTSKVQTRQYDIFGTLYTIKSRYLPVVIDVGGSKKQKVMSDTNYLMHFVWDRQFDIYEKLNLKKYSTLRKYITENFKEYKKTKLDESIVIYKFL